MLKIWRKVRGVILGHGVAAQDADDIVQEAFARLESYTRAHELQSREAFLVTTALNISRDQGRRRAYASEVGDFDLESIVDTAPRPEEQLRAQERLRRADAGLERLDPITRRCLLAQRLDGMTFPQIAEREGMSLAAVEKRVTRAMVFLTQWMDGY
ncbi:RNA polymerase sigma factor [Pelomonas sp. KK5]|uniref:RNA polymerase sigma factor n=1 Tax=Pelomonas sp. KK5 TaxID=1855730 RepID=UPI0018E9F766|nr:sigma-70 family RNA polymerase sigma factor [Pelomonas sp. KK5]